MTTSSANTNNTGEFTGKRVLVTGGTKGAGKAIADRFLQGGATVGITGFPEGALARLGPRRILTTPGLYVLAIRGGVVSVEEADGDKVTLEACRFKMDFASFRDLV
jgi:NAD(P)-dependent dehydrogenase (short-subunit alcohol dehydrogenase family)